MTAKLVRVRTCKKCETEKPYSEFYTNSKGCRGRTCKECDRSSERERKKNTTSERSASHRNWRNKRRGYALTNVARFRAKKRLISFDLEPSDIQRRIDLGSCEMSGIPFDLSKPRGWNAPSLDRIDSRKGYTKENVRVVLYAINVMANTWGTDKILEIASAISSKRKAIADTQ